MANFFKNLMEQVLIWKCRGRSHGISSARQMRRF